MSTFGANIKKIRKERNMTQKDLADILNRSVVTIRKWESGERSPKSYILPNIAEALNIPLSDLYENNSSDEYDFSQLKHEYKKLEVIENLLKHFNYVINYTLNKNDEFNIEIKSLISNESKFLTHSEYLEFINKTKHFIDFEFYYIDK